MSPSPEPLAVPGSLYDYLMAEYARRIREAVERELEGTEK